MSNTSTQVAALVIDLGFILGLWCHSNDINRRLDRIAAALERAYPIQAEAK